MIVAALFFIAGFFCYFIFYLIWVWNRTYHPYMSIYFNEGKFTYYKVWQRLADIEKAGGGNVNKARKTTNFYFRFCRQKKKNFSAYLKPIEYACRESIFPENKMMVYSWYHMHNFTRILVLWELMIPIAIVIVANSFADGFYLEFNFLLSAIGFFISLVITAIIHKLINNVLLFFEESSYEKRGGPEAIAETMVLMWGVTAGWFWKDRYWYRLNDGVTYGVFSSGGGSGGGGFGGFSSGGGFGGGGFGGGGAGGSW